MLPDAADLRPNRCQASTEASTNAAAFHTHAIPKVWVRPKLFAGRTDSQGRMDQMRTLP